MNFLVEKKRIIETVWFEYIEAYYIDKKSTDSSTPQFVDNTNRNIYMNSLEEKVRKKKSNLDMFSKLFINTKSIVDEINKRRYLLDI